MKNIFFVLFMLLGMNLFAQSSTGVKSLDDFSGLKVVGNIEVELIPSDVNEADIKIKSKELSDLVFDINDEGVLKIRFESKVKAFANNNKAKIALKYKNIRIVKALAGAKVRAEEPITSDRLTLLCSSGGFMQLKLKINELDAVATAGAKIFLTGDAHTQKVKSVAGAKYFAKGLYSNNVNAKCTSGAKLTVWCTEKLIAKATSGGKLFYKGNPKEKDISNPRGAAVIKI